MTKGRLGGDKYELGVRGLVVGCGGGGDGDGDGERLLYECSVSAHRFFVVLKFIVVVRLSN